MIVAFERMLNSSNFMGPTTFEGIYTEVANPSLFVLTVATEA